MKVEPTPDFLRELGHTHYHYGWSTRVSGDWNKEQVRDYMYGYYSTSAACADMTDEQIQRVVDNAVDRYGAWRGKWD